jgi:hypothetical protein
MMKRSIHNFWLGIFLLVTAGAEPVSLEEKNAKHREGASVVADAQDELAADVQQLVIEQTLPDVIKLLKEVEGLMDEATNRLADGDTGGETISAQTAIIEKIHAAAKERQASGVQSAASDAMMDMLERMMGRSLQGEGKGENSKMGGNSGQQSDDISNQVDDVKGESSDGETAKRRVPKASGGAHLEIPNEFKKLLDAYNRGAEKLVK